MPASLSFPGVYIDEVPSGVRTISGVATSITAFIGRAARGPVNEPVTLTSFGDFERTFGGLWQGSSLGHAVRAYFQNGGATAIVVRLYRKNAGKDFGGVTVGAGAGALKLRAISPGAWGGSLRAAVDWDINTTAASRLGLAVTPARVQELARWFRGRFDLLTRADMEAFLAASGLSLAQFTRTMQAMAALDAVQQHHARDIEAELPTHTAIMSVRDFILLREQSQAQP